MIPAAVSRLILKCTVWDEDRRLHLFLTNRRVGRDLRPERNPEWTTDPTTPRQRAPCRAEGNFCTIERDHTRPSRGLGPARGSISVAHLYEEIAGALAARDRTVVGSLPDAGKYRPSAIRQAVG